MTGAVPKPLVSASGVFLAAATLALAFSFVTQHAWEDYFITYKASKNLVAGNGPVFHAGERVQTYTSPLGMLLPALACVVTGQASDDAALWVFRVMSIAAFAGGAALVFRTCSGLRMNRLAAVMLVAWLILDIKSLDFSINGMETGILLLFVGYALWAMFVCARRPWRHIGLAWAGLMWTRPDGCLYIALLTLGTLIFNPGVERGSTRAGWCRTLAGAAAVCTVVYLPWFVGTWLFYGSPVPNTAIAKSLAAGPKSFMGALQALAELPFALWTGGKATNGLLTPSNHSYGGWPEALNLAALLITWLSMMLWMFPGQRRETRVASLTAFGLLWYLEYFPNYPHSWYFPGPAWLALFALGGAFSSLLETAKSPPGPGRFASWLLRATRPLAIILALAFVALECWVLVENGRLIRVQQTVVDGGHRRSVGLWLKAHAAPGDRVFMECLGYFGYYSGMKTLDYPGLSSREVVDTVRRVGTDWHDIITTLKPEWLVLRPYEVFKITRHGPALLNRDYHLVETLDASSLVEHLKLHGSGFIAFDTVFMIFHSSNS